MNAIFRQDRQSKATRRVRVKEKLERLKFIEERNLYEGSLYEFVKAAWSSIDSSEFKSNWAIEAFCDHLEAMTRGHCPRLLANYPPRCAKTTIASICWPAWVWAQTEISFLSGPQVRFLCGSYNADLSLKVANKSRNLILSPFYQKYWGDRFQLKQDQNSKGQFDNTKGGSRISTSVGGSLLGLGGDVICIDDPHNTETEKVIETDADRKRVASWFKEVRSTRLNDPKQTTIVVIMQRLHENDLSGVILESDDEDWTHLMIPMEFDQGRRTPTIVLPQYDYPDGEEAWTDPRTKDGELMWPERFGHREVERMKGIMGPYMCTPAESPVLMGDLSLRPISQVKPGDEVIGFTTDTGAGANSYRRRHLQKAKVKAVTTIVAPVVKMTLDSGEVIRCTPDHRWYMGKKGGRRGRNDVRPLYRPARVGTELMRVCPPRLPELAGEDLRMAGWLSGFFDGEGTVALCAKNGPQYRKSSTIRFFQGAGRNLPLCDLLEATLTRFGFSFSYRETVRNDRKYKADHKNRIYTLSGPSGVPLFQRFLHVAQPHKWHDRVVQGALGTKWITGKEKVVSIEPDGVEQVYALETETGNYVVWGLASANSSGRLQQAPVPKGGGIIMRDWWCLWDQQEAQRYGLEWNGAIKEFPPFELVVGSIDTSYGEKQENDFNAMTVWGIWIDRNRNRRAMLMFGWAKRLKLNGKVIAQLPNEAKVNYMARQKEEWGLIEWVADTAKRYRVKRLIIEDKTRGRDVANEINRLYARENWGVELINPVKDKVSRTHGVVPLFTDNGIWAPNTKWAEAVIAQSATFPKGAHDDMHDTVTQFLNWARENGILSRADEMSAALEDEMRPKGHDRGVAEMYGV